MMGFIGQFHVWLWCVLTILTPHNPFLPPPCDCWPLPLLTSPPPWSWLVCFDDPLSLVKVVSSPQHPRTGLELQAEVEWKGVFAASEPAQRDSEQSPALLRSLLFLILPTTGFYLANCLLSSFISCLGNWFVFKITEPFHFPSPLSLVR